MLLFFLLGIIGGMLIPVQTLINAKLNAHTHSMIYTSNISFFIGVIFLILLNLFINPHLMSLEVLLKQKVDVNWFLGGILGVIYLTGNQFSLHKIGSSLTVIMSLMGQLIIGLFIDSFGLFGIKQIPFTFFKVLVIILFILGAILINKKEDKVNNSEKNKIKWIVLAILFGFCPPVQNVVNHQLGVNIHSSFLASLISFIIGFIVLTILTLFTNKSFKFYKLDEHGNKFQITDFLGGILGVAFITINLIIVSIVGTTTTTILSFLGQIFIAIAIDHFGLLGVSRKALDKKSFCGLILFILSIILSRF